MKMDSNVKVLGRFERWNLLLPFAFFLVIPFELLFGSRNGEPYASHIASAIGDILLLNSLHTILTIAMLLYLPEFREFIHRKTGGRPHLFWLKVAAIFFGIFFIFVFAQQTKLNFQTDSALPLTLALLALAFFWLPSVHHNIAQIRGFSLAYNFQLRRNHSGLPLGERLERFLFLIFNLSICAAVLTVALEMRYSQNFGGLTKEIRFCSLILAFLSAAVISVNSLRVFARSRGKFIYLLRNFLWPLTLFSQTALVGIKAMHGFEYVFLFSNFSNASTISAKQRAVFIRVASLMFIGTLLIASGSYWTSNPLITGARSTGGIIIYALMHAILYSHYYLDGYIFRMSQPESRDAIGPLLYRKD
jgi:hypothetical protein